MLKRQREQAKREKKVAKAERKEQRKTEGDSGSEFDDVEVVRETPVEDGHQW
jgi:hypothetical protein